MTDDLELKRCARCAAMIPKTATKCAYCDTSEPDKLVSRPRAVVPRGFSVTRTLIAINLVFFALSLYVFLQLGTRTPLLQVLLTGTGIGFRNTLVSQGAYYHPWAVGKGELWRALAAAFLHGGVIHLAVNLFSLHTLGEFAEKLLGGSKLLVIYLVGAVASTLGAGVFLTAVQGEKSAVVVGASGAVFALLGALAAFLIKRATGVGLDYGKRLLVHAAMMIGLGFYLPFVSNAGHVAGFFAGLLFGLVIRDAFSLKINPSSRKAWALVALLLGAATLFCLGKGFVGAVQFGAKA